MIENEQCIYEKLKLLCPECKKHYIGCQNQCNKMIMRTLVLIFFITAGLHTSWGQCNPYYMIKEGTKWEMTNYNGKGKMEGRQVTVVDKFDQSGNGWDAVMSVKVYDKKDKLAYEADDVEMSCADGVISMNMERFVPQESLAAFKDMNMNLEVDNLELPDNLEVGMTLDDGGVTITGDMPMALETVITDRKVTAKESITTPAGTFDCYKVTYTVDVKMVMNRQMTGAEWITKDVGMIKSETYNNSGKLMSYSELTGIE